ncbi:diaminobutyrate--2-oxoglutarate transaminase family protein [Halococcus sp. IIIV-5B]|uniref:diaminobutyrate--2-oxoglutarate transaminase family protein n=1 Tax=Halococcus sp. IIIV-5B TaxID=2321230 RepID=UPI000E71F154|nr:diaminobutyrate--2-oxoglutarate transaminase family protein [Halococcus sp. IIIV-5B]RJT07101.1 aminotransferase class III-fold pyridoxal phosphate-dependent enzyme [Halococcus sp. IIIV-5B]
MTNEINRRSEADGVPSNEAYLGRQRSRESNARTYPRYLPMAVERASGVELVDVEGNRYYDCLAGAGSIPLGHNHPAVVDALEEVLESESPSHTLDLTTPVRDAFLDTLFATLPDEFAEHARVQFCSPAGTDAVEASLKLMQTATGNRDVLAFRGAYHGMTAGSLALMGDVEPREHVEVPGHVHHFPYPNSYRPPLGIGGPEEHQALATEVETALSDPLSGIEDPAAMIIEPVLGEGGSVPAPNEWLQSMRRITREHGVPLIVDEIQTGIGRTGSMYAFEHADIIPDAILLSKAVGGGVPLSVLVYHERYDEWTSGAHVGTFRGHQFGMAAGRAALEYIVENDVPSHVTRVGEQLRQRLKSTAENHPSLAEVRGRGLMLGVEIVNPSAAENSDGSYPTDAALAEAIQRKCFEKGLIVERGGREGATVRFLPPLVITESEVDDVGTRFDAGVVATLGD